MTFTHAEELMALLREQNLFLNGITIALESIADSQKSKAFNDFYKNVSTQDLAGR